jgi:hypothetical protein
MIMAIEIKELIIRGIVNQGDNESEIDIVELIKDQIESYNFALTSDERREIIQDCISEVKSLIDRKSNY